MLVCICLVNSLCAVVPLLSHNPDVSLDLFGILVISYTTNIKVPNVGRKLCLDNTDYYLPLVSNM